MDSLEKMKTMKELPPMECFDSFLTGQGISCEDYEKTKSIYKKLNFR